SQVFFFLGRFGQLRLKFEVVLEIADAQLAPVKIRVPVKSSVLNRTVLPVRTVDRIQHQSTILHAAANGAKLGHGPGKRHPARARNQSKCGTEAGGSATSRRRSDRAKRL